MGLYPPVLANNFLPEWYKKTRKLQKRRYKILSSVPHAWGQRKAKKMSCYERSYNTRYCYSCPGTALFI